MIKNFLKLVIVMSLMNTGCSAQKDLLVSSIEASTKKQPAEDSVLHRLQGENDLVIAYAVENFAWVRSIDYRILVQNNNEWKGYRYHANLMRSNAGTPTSITPVNVDKAGSDSLLNYITAKKVWDIKGDSESGPCRDGNKNCNINDAAGARLWIITKNGSINPSYDAPEFYENCCPDEQRGLFLSITKKIAGIIGDSGASE